MDKERLIKFLEEKGFVRIPQSTDTEITYQIKTENLPKCECNDRSPALNITLYIIGEYSLISCNIIAECNGIWGKVGAYSISEDELIDRYDRIIEATEMAWNTFHKFMSSPF